jgi:hypothetical protein
MRDNERRMVTMTIPVDHLPWEDEAEEMDEAYDLLWSHVPPPHKVKGPWLVADLQGNLLRAILMGIKWGAKNAEAIKRRQAEQG